MAFSSGDSRSRAITVQVSQEALRREAGMSVRGPREGLEQRTEYLPCTAWKGTGWDWKEEAAVWLCNGGSPARISRYSLYYCPVPSCALMVSSELSLLIHLCIPGEAEATYLLLLSSLPSLAQWLPTWIGCVKSEGI